MFGFNKKKEEATVTETTPETPEAATTETPAAETAEAPSLEQVIDQRNGEIARLQLLLGQIRENSARQEQQALTALAAAREALTAAVRELGTAQGVDVDDGGRWNFDLTSKTFTKSE